MHAVLLVTILNVAAHVETESASTLVREREKELDGKMDLKMALEMIQYHNEIPAEIHAALKPKQHKGAVRRASLVAVADTAPDAETARKLDEARVILNKMYIANQEELDVVIWDCRTWIHAQIALMDENTRLRTEMGAAAARAKALQLEAGAGIKTAKGELLELNSALKIHEDGCSETLTAARNQEAILANDYEVGMMIQNATEKTCMKKAGVLLLECRADASKGETVEDELKFELGPDYKDLDTHFTTPLAREAMQRMMRLSLHPDSHPHFGLLEINREEMRSRRMRKGDPTEPKAVEAEVAPAPAPISDAHAEAMELPDRPKCSTDSADCPLLFDQVAAMVGEILDGLQKIRKAIATEEDRCKQATERYEGQIATWEGSLDEDQVKLAEAIELENTNNEALRQKVIEYEGLNTEYLSKKAECDAKKTEITNTLCGIKIVRLEVYHNEEVYDILMQDCEVGDWVDQDCSVTCGGGMQDVTREILQVAGPKENPGAECPPVLMTQKCNSQDCPIDCVMTDWSEWTSCTKDCGSGIKQKARSVAVDAKNGGLACEATDNAQVCNMNACDVDCVLAPWTEWDQCSKACNGGIEIRRKPILFDILGMGKCASENDKTRFEEKACNLEACPPNLVCNSKADIVLVLDGSGSVREPGFAATKLFAKNLVERLEMGEEGVKVGLIRFSKTIDVLEQMTFDKEGLLAKIDGMTFPRQTTSTSVALSTALDVLKAGGRKEVEKTNTIVFMVTDGKPNNAEASDKMAETVRAAARLVVAPVGTGMGAAGLEQMMSWATFPPEENVLQADSYAMLPGKISNFIADLCMDLKCSEASDEPDMSDYIGCQTETVTGNACMKWTETEAILPPAPEGEEGKALIQAVAKGGKGKGGRGKGKGKGAPGPIPAPAIEGNIVGGHNYCRNPDNKEGGIWCYTINPEVPWEYCNARPLNATDW